jgi:hypothetical protein
MLASTARSFQIRHGHDISHDISAYRSRIGAGRWALAPAAPLDEHGDVRLNGSA